MPHIPKDGREVYYLHTWGCSGESGAGLPTRSKTAWEHKDGRLGWVRCCGQGQSLPPAPRERASWLSCQLAQMGRKGEEKMKLKSCQQLSIRKWSLVSPLQGSEEQGYRHTDRGGWEGPAEMCSPPPHIVLASWSREGPPFSLGLHGLFVRYLTKKTKSKLAIPD